MTTFPFPITDIVVSILMILFFWRGWCLGFLRSILGPLCLVICAVFGIIHYDVNGDLIQAIILTLVGSFVLSLAIRIFLFMSRSSSGKNKNDHSLVLGRVLGGILNLSWKGIVVLSLVVLISLIPFDFLHLDKIKADIHRSQTLEWINTYLIIRTPYAQTVTQIQEVFENPQQFEQLRETREYREFASDPKIRKLFSNQHFVSMVRSRDFSGIFSMPEVKEVLQDRKARKAFSALGKRIYEESLPETPAE